MRKVVVNCAMSYEMTIVPNSLRQRGLLLFAVLLCVASCSKQPALNALPTDATILAFGDSLTFGTGAQPHESYPALLAKLLQRKVINGGVPGELSATGLARLPTWLDEHRPALMILCHGGNDMLHKKSLDQAAANLGDMIGLARARNIQVVMLGVPRPGLLLSAADFYQDVVEQTQVPYDGETLAHILAKRGLKSDPVHPNAAGYAKLARGVFELLDDSGAL